MQRSGMRYEFLLLALFLLNTAVADPFSGDFSASLDNGVYRLSIGGLARGQYDGEYLGEGERLPLSARRFGDRIVGQVGIAADGFSFLGQIQNGHLLMQYEDGRVILFRRISATTRRNPD